MQWPQTPSTCRRCVMKTSNPFNLVGGVWKRLFTQFYRSFCHVSTSKRAFNLVFGRLAWPKTPLNLPISHVQTCFTPFNLSKGVASRPSTPFNLSEGVASRPSTPFNLSEVCDEDLKPRSTCRRCWMVTLEFAPFLQNIAFNVRPFHYFAIFATNSSGTCRQ